MAADVLTAAGWSVVIFEKGRNHLLDLDDPTQRKGEYSNDEIKFMVRHFLGPDPLLEPRTFRRSATDGERAFVGDVNNVPFRQRGRIGEEAIEALKAVWGPDPVEYHGKYFNIEPSVIGPKPVQKPHPPILVGAFAPKALDRAGRLADGFTGCCAPVDALIAMMNAVKAAATERGRDGEALQYVMRCIVTRTDQPVEGPDRPVAVGTWDQIRADAQKLADAGVDESFFDVSFQPDVNDLKSYLGYMDRFRAILEVPVAV